jgi:hypothetical protein
MHLVEGMMKKTAAALLLFALLATSGARAMDQDLVMRCILQEILSALTCKAQRDFRFVGKRNEVYVFNTHYGGEFAEFYCQVFDKDVVVTSKAWNGKMGSARLNYEAQPGCISATVNSPEGECSYPHIVQCCGSD